MEVHQSNSPRTIPKKLVPMRGTGINKTKMSQITEKKAGWQDLTADFERGFLKKNMEDMDVEVQGSTKRPAPGDTPDREAQANTKSQASESPNKNRGPDLQGVNIGGDPHGIENGYARKDHELKVCHGQPVNEQNG